MTIAAVKCGACGKWRDTSKYVFTYDHIRGVLHCGCLKLKAAE